MSSNTQVDHLVLLAASLAQGVHWCEQTLGICPGPGGQHVLMSTHNRLFKIASPRFPRAYFEIIAIDPQAPAPNRRRWFDMDDTQLQKLIAHNGPQLIHFVVSVSNVQAGTQSLQALGLDRGDVLQASRATSSGLLQWQISVREDGQRLMDGCLPTLIQWGDRHPFSTMIDSGIELLELQVTHPQSETLSQAFIAIGLQDVAIHPGPAQLSVRLSTPRGTVELHSRVH